MNDDLCPVCVKGETEKQEPFRDDDGSITPISTFVSHLDCVRQLDADNENLLLKLTDVMEERNKAEADLTALKKWGNEERQKKEQAEAEVAKLIAFCNGVCEPWQIVEDVKDELAALKAQRCETCKFCVYGTNDTAFRHGVTNPITGWCDERGGLWWLRDFCSRWQPREEAT